MGRALRFRMLKVLAFSGFTALIASQVFAEGITKVKGHVADNLGKPLANVAITFEAVDIKKTVGGLRTNKQGDFFIATLDVSIAKKWKVTPKLDGYKVVSVAYEIVDSESQDRGKGDQVLGSKQEFPEMQFALIGDAGRNVVNFVMAKDADFVAATQAEQKKRRDAAGGGTPTADAAAPAAAPAAPAAPKISTEGAQQLTQAKQLADAGNHAQAITIYQAYLAKDPKDNPAVYYYLGKSLFQTGDDAGATASFKKGLELDPKMKGAHFFLGNIGLKEDDATTAVAEYEQELKLSPESDTVLYNLGQAYFKAGDTDKAIAALDHAATVNPTKPEIFMLMGTVYDAKGDKVMADQMYQKVAAIDPRNAAILFFNTGVKSWNENRPKEAVVAYRKATEIDPNYAQAHRELARALMAQQDFAGALQHFQEYLKINPKAPDAKEIQESIALLKK